MKILDTIPELIRIFADNGINLIDEHVQDNYNAYPLITYQEDDNIDNMVGSNMGYSDIKYIINIWAYSRKEIMLLAQQVDHVMKSIMFNRTGSAEQNNNTMYRKILTYKRTVKEEY